MPKIDLSDAAEQCPTCLAAKLRRSNRNKAPSTTEPTECFQGVCVDMGFIVQQSSDSERVRQLTGLHGETCYVLISDLKSGTLEGVNKLKPPISCI